jgi:oligopeptide/dipeptide ABC transporter ATP-binding protein
MNGHGAAVNTLEIAAVTKTFTLRRRGLPIGRRPRVEAVSGVDLTIPRGSTTGLVGESGSGKTTVGRIAARLIEPTSGAVHLDGRDITALKGRALHRIRRDVQVVFQDPYSSFAPYSTLLDSVGEPLQTHTNLRAAQRRDRVSEVFESVGLSRYYAERYPRELSGGQLQRAAIARSLIVEPKLLVLDEPVSALDVSTQAQVINLLVDLQERLGLTYLFIGHDLSVVRHVSRTMAVMYLGRLAEVGPADDVYEAPTHPYTMALLSAVPVADPTVQRRRRRMVLTGEIPSPANPPSGCRFRTRCPFAMDICASEQPAAFPTPSGGTVYCHLHTSGPRLRGASVRDLAVGKPPVTVGEPG